MLVSFLDIYTPQVQSVDAINGHTHSTAAFLTDLYEESVIDTYSSK